MPTPNKYANKKPSEQQNTSGQRRVPLPDGCDVFSKTKIVYVPVKEKK